MNKLLGLLIVIAAVEALGTGFTYLLQPRKWYVGALATAGLMVFIAAFAAGVSLMSS